MESFFSEDNCQYCLKAYVLLYGCEFSLIVYLIACFPEIFRPEQKGGISLEREPKALGS